MKKFKGLTAWVQRLRWPIGRKLTAAFGCLIAILLANTLATLALQVTINSKSQEERTAFATITTLQELEQRLIGQQNLYFDFVLVNRQQNFTDGFGFSITNLINSLQKLDPASYGPGSGNFGQFLAKYEQLKDYYNQIATATAAADFDEALKVYQNSKPTQDQTNNLLKLAQQEALKKREALVAEQASSNNAIILINLVVNVSGLLLAILLSVTLTRAISRPILQVVQNLKEVAQGKLEQRAHLENQDELGILAATFNQTAQTLQDNRQLLSEQTRQITDRMNRLESQLDEFTLNLTTARHDLKGPLSNIYNLLDLLELRLNGKLLAEPDKLRAVTLETVERVNQILEDCARMINLTLRQDPRPLMLETIGVDQLIARSLELVGTGGLQFTLKVDPIQARADYTLLEHALLNLIFNAKKFAASRIELGARLVRAGESDEWKELETDSPAQDLDLLELWVWNDGETIPAGEQQRIFLPGKQTQAGREAGGQGLGLVIVKSIAEKHRGYVTLFSQPGKGTRFTILIPQSEAEAGAASPNPPNPPREGQTEEERRLIGEFMAIANTISGPLDEKQ